MALLSDVDNTHDFQPERDGLITRNPERHLISGLSEAAVLGLFFCVASDSMTDDTGKDLDCMRNPEVAATQRIYVKGCHAFSDSTPGWTLNSIFQRLHRRLDSDINDQICSLI